MKILDFHNSCFNLDFKGLFPEYFPRDHFGIFLRCVSQSHNASQCACFEVAGIALSYFCKIVMYTMFVQWWCWWRVHNNIVFVNRRGTKAVGRKRIVCQSQIFVFSLKATLKKAYFNGEDRPEVMSVHICRPSDKSAS